MVTNQLIVIISLQVHSNGGILAHTPEKMNTKMSDNAEYERSDPVQTTNLSNHQNNVSYCIPSGKMHIAMYSCHGPYI